MNKEPAWIFETSYEAVGNIILRWNFVEMAISELLAQMISPDKQLGRAMTWNLTWSQTLDRLRLIGPHRIPTHHPEILSEFLDFLDMAKTVNKQRNDVAHSSLQNTKDAGVLMMTYQQVKRGVPTFVEEEITLKDLSWTFEDIGALFQMYIRVAERLGACGALYWAR